ncbi:hypothetical protein [Neisseria elongata]|jgi:hypothetical protein|uniref:hypothetical protein n=1 Tax=Neisseria elongata TaxID=495 RepID=UPI0028E2971A|nr:hypothetical protein [Neisseria elongata]
MRKILLLVAALSFAPAAFSTSLTKEEIAEYNRLMELCKKEQGKPTLRGSDNERPCVLAAKLISKTFVFMPIDDKICAVDYFGAVHYCY